MYRLSIEFKNLEELTSFVVRQGNGESVTAAKIDVVPAAKVEEVKPEVKLEVKAAPAKKAVEKKAVEVVVPEPVKAEVVIPAIDRAAYIAKATSLVATLKTTGLADDQLMPKVHEVYAQANCPLNLRISQLSDEQLISFLPLFEAKVASIVASKKENAFI